MLAGRLDPAALRQALNEVVRRHRVLRTTVAAGAGQPVLTLAPRRALPVPVPDLTRLDPAAAQAEVRRVAAGHLRRPFDLERGPLLRAVLVRLAAEEHVLLLACHQLVADEASLELCGRELAELYHAFAAGRPSPLPRPGLRFTDFAVRQRQWTQGPEGARQLAYWKRQLAAAPAVLDLPTDHPRPAVPSYRGARRTLALAPERTAEIRALSRRLEVPPSVVLLAAVNELLGRYLRPQPARYRGADRSDRQYRGVARRPERRSRVSASPGADAAG
ncbi:MAG: hypothetical protein GY856_35535, partial [bacterium]|nr:hypothetical protein [bacterium]